MEKTIKIDKRNITSLADSEFHFTLPDLLSFTKEFPPLIKPQEIHNNYIEKSHVFYRGKIQGIFMPRHGDVGLKPEVICRIVNNDRLPISKEFAVGIINRKIFLIPVFHFMQDEKLFQVMK